MLVGICRGNRIRSQDFLGGKWISPTVENPALIDPEDLNPEKCQKMGEHPKDLNPIANVAPVLINPSFCIGGCPWVKCGESSLLIKTGATLTKETTGKQKKEETKENEWLHTRLETRIHSERAGVSKNISG